MANGTTTGNAATLGTPTRRVEGALKVTGAAKYAGEYAAEGLLHGAIASSTIAKGRITKIDVSRALALPGVVHVFTHENRPDVSDKAKDYNDQVAAPGKHFRPLGSADILFNQQPIALVVAESFEAARDASALIDVEYAVDPHCTDLDVAKADAYDPPKKRTGIKPPPKPRGDFAKAFAAAPVKVEASYAVPFEHHNAMEPFATTCIANGDGTFTLYDKTQGSQNAQAYILAIFDDLKKEQVRVVNSYVGGAFGSGLRPQYPIFFSLMAAKALSRSVRVVLTREQMFTFTHRPSTTMTVKLGADTNGKLTAIHHDALAGTSTFEDHQEVVVNWSSLQYHADNVELTYALAKLDTYTPGDMRAPGAVIGQFAMESAIDELAYATGVDPVAIRQRNATDKDENENKQFTSKALAECYRQGAEAFGWAKRSAPPRSMKDGRELVGWGVAGAVWEALVQKTAAEARMTLGGHLIVSSATSDIGTGMYTVMTQTGADAFGLPLDHVTAKLGDSNLPAAPVEGGSWGAASTCSAIQAACEKLKKELLSSAKKIPGAPIGHPSVDEVDFRDGMVMRKDDPAKRVTLHDLVEASGETEIAAAGAAAPSLLDALRYASYTHAAVFVEVRVDEELGTVRVTRIVDAVAAGRILNPKTARSQILGGVVMAMGSALHEETLMDTKLGRFMNHNLAEYHVPAHADVESLEVIFVDERDEKTSPIGAKGLGEIGIVGTGAAIANAIFHATGRRVRSLPITVDKVLGL